MTWLQIFTYLTLVYECPANEHLFQTIDVAKLSTNIYGTELILVDNRFKDQKTYKFEDFFWTGSGDGEDTYEDTWETKTPSTIYKTKTVYLEATTYNESISDDTTKCPPNCPNIIPTPTQEETDDLNADRQFWLITLLQSDGKDPIIIELKNSLAKLYRIAFQRQQERHLGIVTNRRKREDKNIKVHVHDINNNENRLQLVYHVSINGKPVDAATAAQDMALVSDEEVRKELGFPFLIKAEPYLKAVKAQGLSRGGNTWIFIGVAIVVALLFLLIVAFVTLGFTKCKKTSIQGVENRQRIFERGTGDINKAFKDSPTYVNFREQASNETIFSGKLNRSQSTISSSCSSASLDISPLMIKKKALKKPSRPKSSLNKTAPLTVKQIAPELLDSDSSRQVSPEINCDPGVISPKSYLSMPSVKSFPRGTMPEPLNKVLEPVSVLHLDMPDEDDLKPHLFRYGSVGAVQDPGVIGPVVWNLHRQCLEHSYSVDEGTDQIPSNVSTMRKRFHDLLDDTFSLFGSRRTSPETVQPIQVKSHSALDKANVESRLQERPKTTGMRSQGPSGPKGAWISTTHSPLVRPVSAINPRVNVDLILAEGSFKEQDPAVPLITAIKNEIEKCSLPGSTSDLRN